MKEEYDRTRVGYCAILKGIKEDKVNKMNEIKWISVGNPHHESTWRPSRLGILSF